MSIAAVPPLPPVQALNPAQGAAHAASMTGVAAPAPAELQATALAQQQLFEMLMQNTQSSCVSEAFKAPREEDED